MRSERLARGVALLAFVGAAPVAAQSKITPYVGAGVEYDSNVFYLPGKREARFAYGEAKLDDFVTRAILGVALEVPFGSQQRFRADVQGRTTTYAHFGQLDHREYLMTGGLDWRASDVLDGLLDFRQERRMKAFADTSSTDLALETERIGRGEANWSVNPEWRVQAGASTRLLRSPLPDDPKFQLEENTLDGALKYVGVEALAAGVFGQVVDGHYTGVDGPRAFEQQTGGLAASYTISGLSKVALQAGYTRRRDRDRDRELAGLTGSLGYERIVSGKTTVGAELFRRVRSDVTGEGFVGEAGLELAMHWQPTEKTGGVVSYDYVRSRFRYLDVRPGPEREDTRHALAIKFTWQALPWLAVRSNLEYEFRNANIDGFDFHGAIVGVEIYVRSDR